LRTGKRFVALVMAGAIFFSMFAGTTFGASARYAVATDVVGTVKVTKAGGTKEIRIYEGMALNEGDTITVEEGSSVTLKLADRDEEIVLDNEFRGALSSLKESAGGGKETAVKTWAGSFLNMVRSLLGTNDTYQVETPTAVMGVRGTHFMVSIDPITGLPTMSVSAGKVETHPSGAPGNPVLLLPAQQITLYPNTYGTDPAAGIEYIDPSSLVGTAGPSVIAALLKNKANIDRENEEMLSDVNNTSGSSTLDIQDEEILEAYRKNVDAMLHQVLKNAAGSGKLTEEQVQEIVRAANQSIEDEKRKFDLNREAPSIDRSAGVDPEKEKLREQQRQQAAQQLIDKVEQREAKKQELQSNLSQVIQQILQLQQQIQQQNQQAAAQKQQEALERFRQQLSEQEREALDGRLQQRSEEKQRQEERKSSQGSADPKPATSEPSDNPTPQPEDPSNPPTDPEEPTGTPTVKLWGEFESDQPIVIIELDHFDGADALYAAQFNIVHDGNLKVVPSFNGTWYNDDKFPDDNVVAEAVTEHGTETIYAITLFGNGTQPVPFSGDILAGIPFEFIDDSTGGTFVVHYQLIRADGTIIKSGETAIELNGETR